MSTGQAGPGDQHEAMTAPLRRMPARFRWWLAACGLALVTGLVLLHVFAPGPDLPAIVREPGAVMLLALILLADVYPTLPWMRGSNPFDEFIFSTPLAIAGLMVYGPHAAIAFVMAGLAMTLALRMRWWRVLLNTSLWGVQGAAAAGVLAVVWSAAGWGDAMPSTALLPMTVVLTVVIEGLNITLVMTSQYLAGATTPRVYLADWRSQVAIGTLDLTAPIPAVLAATQPALLPLLAVAMVAAQAGLGAVTSRTAQAGTDVLTSVPNRAFLLARIKAALAAADRHRSPVMVLLIDLDRFKQINDEFGHLVGDRVLIEVARRIEESTRSGDVVARFGGDEFAVLLGPGSGSRPGSGSAQRSAPEVAGRIRTAVARPIEVADWSVLIGVSIGWAVADRLDTDPLALLRRADAQLYAAKAARPVAPRPAGSGAGAAPMAGGAGDDGRPDPRSIWQPVWTGTASAPTRSDRGA